ncbi:MAG: hypothetical protein U1E37_00505 [Sphingomonadaceae bacterium]
MSQEEKAVLRQAQDSRGWVLALLELDIENWADIKDRCGKLVHLVRPRDLDPALGPELA